MCSNGICEDDFKLGEIMKIFQINTVYNSASTGRIAADIKHALEAEGHECFVAYGRGNSDEKNTECVSNKLDLYSHVFLTRATDKTGMFSKKSTKRTIELIEEFGPDVIHLHNIHGYYLDYRMLFEFLAAYNKPIVWTLHDCWPYTGHCAYYDMAGCEKWKTGCHKCPALEQYPKAFVDNSKVKYETKKKYFNLVEKMVFVTPSKWLGNEVKKSFLGKYDVRVINNGIDTDCFKYTEGNIREKYDLGDKKIVLGIASVWDKRKGLEDFVELAEHLSSEYQIVLVGVSEQQIKQLPASIKAIRRTESKVELAQLYSAAEVLFNPTYEDNYPTVNLESLACGTPVITYNTGGSPESAFVDAKDCVEKKNYEEICNRIYNVNKVEIDREKINISQMKSAYLDLYVEMKEW